MAKKIIISGGGTGGHVFPAISIAMAIKDLAADSEILFVGAENKLEMTKVPEAGFKIIGLPVKGFQRKITFRNVLFFYYLWRSMRKSMQIIKEFCPDIAVGVGGYASGPVLRAAVKRKIPIVIQEQNSFAGVTNKILAKHAQRIFVAYDGMEKYFPSAKVINTGNPLRSIISSSGKLNDEALDFFKLENHKPVLLVIGGSLGAGAINNSIRKGIESFGSEIQVIWQTGKYYYDSIISDEGLSEKTNIKVYPFIDKMEMAYEAAHVIISRAGAGTISELALVGKPVILVPSPNVAEDHQTKNAMALVEKGAAVMVRDKDAENELVSESIELLRDEEKKARLSAEIKKLAVADAAERIATEILEIA